MARIIQFPLKPDGKFGLKPARAKRKKSSIPGQLDLFQTPQEAKVIAMSSNPSFDQAVAIHDQNPELALSLYQKSIDKEQHVADAHCNQGIIFSTLNQQAKAVDAFTRALQEEPRHFEAHFNLANSYTDAGNYSLSALHYRIASEIEPEDPNIFYNLALVCALDEKYTEALHALQQYFDKLPSNTIDADARQLMAVLETSINTRKEV